MKKDQICNYICNKISFPSQPTVIMSYWNTLEFYSQRGCGHIGYRSTNLKLKSREIFFDHDMQFNCPIILHILVLPCAVQYFRMTAQTIFPDIWFGMRFWETFYVALAEPIHSSKYTQIFIGVLRNCSSWLALTWRSFEHGGLSIYNWHWWCFWLVDSKRSLDRSY